jgi:choice-of-anchor A domain-containing protein
MTPWQVSTSPMTTTSGVISTASTTTRSSEPKCSELAPLKHLGAYNLITLEDLSTNSDVEYKTLVCGSLVGASSANFGIHLDKASTSPLTSVLEVARSISSGSTLNVQTGSVSVGQSSDKITKQGNVQYTVNENRQFNINGGNEGARVLYDSKLVEKCQEVKVELKNVSAILARKSANNDVNFPKDQPAPLTLSVTKKDSDGVAIFTVPDGNALFRNQKVQQIEIDNNRVQATLIVVNVGGKTVSFDGGNIVGSLTQLDTRSRVLFNFYEAEEINMQRNFMGSLLAPFAKVQTNANIDGATVVKSLSTTSELHKPLLVVPLCAATPAATTPMAQTSKLSEYSSHQLSNVRLRL